MGTCAEPMGPRSYDVIVIGAGVSGLYATYHFREAGLRVRALDEAAEVGGTWWWNSYPGARVDVPGGPFYCYTFSEELAREWTWKETQPDQPAVHGYLKHVADRFDLHSHIQLSTHVSSARFDSDRSIWITETSDGELFESQFLVSAVGTLSAPHTPDIPGFDSFRGEVVHPGRWPRDHEVKVDGARVGVIGTGSSGIQIIPQLAKRAQQLTVFQRTPQYTVPARNRSIPPELQEAVRTQWATLREKMFVSPGGMPNMPRASVSALSVTEEERQEAFERAWEQGGLGIGRVFSDLQTDPKANKKLTDFIRSKILATVNDPEVASRLLPDYFYGAKRAVLDEGYYETFNKDNVTLVDIRQDPILEVHEHGIRTERGDHRLDTLIVATGYDAISGALLRLNPQGSGGIDLSSVWSSGTRTYLGLTVPGFPNLFLIHGPQTPSVLYNMPFGAERQTEWIMNCISYIRRQGKLTVAPSEAASEAWAQRVRAVASGTLFPETDSWYVGANIPGKPREMLIYADGIDFYRQLDAVSEASGYPGLSFTEPDPTEVSAEPVSSLTDGSRW